jgi:TonB family protein
MGGLPGRAFLGALSALRLLAQAPAGGADDAVRIGPGVVSPRPLRQDEPKYSDAGRRAGVQGTVILEIVVDEKGRATEIKVISPLGFGLDEQAVEAVAKWRFAPGTKDGRPVKVLAEVEVNFRLQGVQFDDKTEQLRGSYNMAARELNRKDNPKTVDRAVESMQNLARQKYPAAVYAVGLWKTSGEHLPKDTVEGLSLFQEAAAMNYGPALYEIAFRRIEGQDLPRDAEQGLEEMRRAATLGSSQAQFYLGNRYERGRDAPPDLEKARQLFRLCAAQSVDKCRYRLGLLLLNAPGRRERDRVEAVAWLQLAGEQGLAEAKDLAAKETMNLTPAQAKAVNSLRTQLSKK